MRVQEQRQDPPGAHPGPLQQVVPVELRAGDDPQSVVPVPGRGLLVRHGLHHHEVLRRRERELQPPDVATHAVLEHLLVEIDPTRGLEQDVHDHVVLQPLVDPVLVGLLRGEPGTGQCVEGPLRVHRTDHHVDVLGPARPSPHRRRDPADHEERDVLAIERFDHLAEHREEHRFLDGLLLEGGRGVGAHLGFGERERFQSLVHDPGPFPGLGRLRVLPAGGRRHARQAIRDSRSACA